MSHTPESVKLQDNSISSSPFAANSPLTSSSVVVVDPLTRKLEVPRYAIYDTKATDREGGASLCLLFMEGRCRQGSECNQIHADIRVVEDLRKAAQALPTCCQFHGDINKKGFESFPNWEGRVLCIEGVIVPMNRTAFTHGLFRSLEQERHSVSPVVQVSATFVCRLQAGGHCRYSEECKFVHICREITSTSLAHCVSPLSTDLERKHKDYQMVRPAGGHARGGTTSAPPPPAYGVFAQPLQSAHTHMLYPQVGAGPTTIVPQTAIYYQPAPMAALTQPPRQHVVILSAPHHHQQQQQQIPGGGQIIMFAPGQQPSVQ